MPPIACSFATLLFAVVLSSSPRAEIFSLPSPTDDLVGGVKYVIARQEDTLIDLALRYGFGYEQIKKANPTVDAWLPKAGTKILLPGIYLLPNAPRAGIVVNTTEMRLYYYPKHTGHLDGTVETYPLSIGRGEWGTPVVETKVVRKQQNPAWYPPESIRREHARQGDILPKVVAAGPQNPLGEHAMYLGLNGYLIHGSNKEFGIGMQVTHGCMRMYSPDIKRLFQQVPIGTPVRIINQRLKVGWHNGILYAEVHPWLDGVTAAEKGKQKTIGDLVRAAAGLRPDAVIDWRAVANVERDESGVPTAIGRIDGFSGISAPAG